MAHFNYDPIRNTAIGLVKKFGRTASCILLRNVEGAVADASKPWRGGSSPTVKQFPFLGTVSTLGFPKRSDPITDREQDIIAPGDLATTAAVGDPSTFCGAPTLTDRILVGTEELAIIGVQDITPDDKTIIFKIRCRAWPQIIQAPSTPF